jgi:hypothetical protein
MRLAVCAALAVMGGCTCGDAVLAVDLTVSPSATTTRCVKVAAVPAGADEQPSSGLAREPGNDTFEVAIYRGDLPETIDVVARGYDDPGCTRLNEETRPNAARFASGQVTRVPLHLDGSPCLGADAGTACPDGVCRSDHACVDAGTEPDCANDADDDGDGLKDCADPDCFDVACAPGDLCQVAPRCLADGGCAGATLTACDVPPGFCFGNPGTCNSSTGACSYAPDASIGCFDSNACTVSDHCLLDGGCGGSPNPCDAPPGTCYGASDGCDPVTGCHYPARTSGGCDDGNLCTFNDRCGGDAGCTGTPYSCSGAGQCNIAGSCLGDGGCSAPVARTGQLCDGGTGVCNASAVCLGFPYAPANFEPGAIAPTLVLPDGGVPGAITLGCAATYNSTDGGITWCASQPLPAATVVTQPGGPDAVVLAMTGLTVSSGGSLTVTGSLPVILAVWGDATVAGTVSAASAIGGNSGAGQGAFSCNAQAGVPDTNTGGGGGGGGFGSRGEDGGTGSPTGRGGRGGGAFGNLIIEPLVGGCPGGAGGKSSTNAGSAGGPGGGAVQISAAGTLTVQGTVTASGAGGSGGLSLSSNANGGGGGGSGGGVLLEGWHISIPNTARLTANGGAGAEGSNMGSTNGTNGEDGSQTTATPVGSGDATTCGGNGGQGGTATGAPGPGANSTSSCGGGGAGGAVGRIRVNGPFQCQVDAGVQSPRPVFNGNCP